MSLPKLGLMAGILVLLTAALDLPGAHGWVVYAPSGVITVLAWVSLWLFPYSLQLAGIAAEGQRAVTTLGQRLAAAVLFAAGLLHLAALRFAGLPPGGWVGRMLVVGGALVLLTSWLYPALVRRERRVTVVPPNSPEGELYRGDGSVVRSAADFAAAGQTSHNNVDATDGASRRGG